MGLGALGAVMDALSSLLFIIFVAVCNQLGLRWHHARVTNVYTRLDRRQHHAAAYSNGIQVEQTTAGEPECNNNNANTNNTHELL